MGPVSWLLGRRAARSEEPQAARGVRSGGAKVQDLFNEFTKDGVVYLNSADFLRAVCRDLSPGLDQSVVKTLRGILHKNEKPMGYSEYNEIKAFADALDFMLADTTNNGGIDGSNADFESKLNTFLEACSHANVAVRPSFHPSSKDIEDRDGYYREAAKWLTGEQIVQVKGAKNEIATTPYQQFYGHVSPGRSVASSMETPS